MLWSYPTLLALDLQVNCLCFTIPSERQIGGWVEIPKLREVRELQGLTQKELADVSGVSVRSVAGYEGGAHVRPNTARKLANALNVDVADLMGVDAHPKADALPPRDPDAAALESEVIFNAGYSPDNYDKIIAMATEVAREERPHRVIPGVTQIKIYIDSDNIEVRAEPVSRSSRSRARGRARHS